jgi:hypothetical protein
MLKDQGKLDKISAVFVDDGGTNYEGGLHCVDAQTDYLAAATAPVNGVFYSDTDKKAMEVNVQPGRRMGGGMAGGSSDHASFLAQGVPGSSGMRSGAPTTLRLAHAERQTQSGDPRVS